MVREDEDYILDSIEQIRKEVHLNNRMLSEICDVINVYMFNHGNENNEDFMRNILANLISSGIDISGLFKRR